MAKMYSSGQNTPHSPYVVVVVPAYNEEKMIDNVTAHIKAELQKEKYRGLAFDVVVVNDGSKDDTARAAQSAGVRVVTHPTNLGLGAATRTGMQRAYEMGADIVIKMDADFQHKPEEIELMILPILEDRADCVFGSRFLGELQYKMPIYRSLGNRFFNWFTGFLTGLSITDAQTGYIAMNRRYLSQASILMNYNKTQQLIIDMWGKGMRIVEVPISTAPRTGGSSFISWKYPFRVIPAMIRTFVHAKPLRSFLLIGTAILCIGIFIGALWFMGRGGFFGDETASILIITGIQIILFGFLADIVVKRK